MNDKETTFMNDKETTFLEFVGLYFIDKVEPKDVIIDVLNETYFQNENDGRMFKYFLRVANEMKKVCPEKVTTIENNLKRLHHV